MKVTCPKCVAQYEVDASLIPPSGVMMRCPACLHTFSIKHPDQGAQPAADIYGHDEFTPPGGVKVRPVAPSGPRSGAPPPPPGGMVSPLAPVPPTTNDTSRDAELPVPKKGEQQGRLGGRSIGPSDPSLRRYEGPDLPAPKRPAQRRDDGLPDLPAPVGPRPEALPRGLRPEPPGAPGVSDLPAPVGPPQKEARPRELADLPAPVATRRELPDLPAPVATRRELPDLPAPIAGGRRGLSDLPAPVGPHRRPELPDLPAPVATRRELPDLPAPIGARRGPPDLPAPVGPRRTEGAPGGRSLPDLPTPVLADLPSPVAADLPIPVSPGLLSPVQPGLPAPVAADLMEPVAPGLLQPVSADSDVDLDDLPPPPMRPVATLDTVTSSGRDEASADDDDPALASLGSPIPAPALDGDDDDVADRLTRPIDDDPDAPALSVDSRRSPRADAGEAPQGEEAPPPAEQEAPPPPRRRWPLIAAAAAVVVLLAGGGAAYFLFLRGRSAEAQTQVDQARHLLGDDFLPSYRKSVDKLQRLVIENPKDGEVLALLALGHLGAARYGVSTELSSAQERLGQVPPADQKRPEAIEARALQDLLAGRLAEARRALAPLSNGAAARKDALLPVYQGWVELRDGKLPIAEKDFRAALALSPKLPAALYGLAQARERAGDRPGARAAYAKVREAQAAHFGAALGAIRTSDDPSGETKLLELVTRSKDSAGPRELGDAWTTLGLKAMEMSRRQDAEDRLRRALAADPTQTTAQVALSRLLCDQEKFQNAADLAKKAFTAEPKNVDAGLVLVRALLGAKKPLDAGAPLEAIAKQKPQDARVLYWQGRREEAVSAPGGDAKAATLYQKAVDSDPRYLDAYIALSRVLMRLGKTTDALAALKQVAAQAEGDPVLAAALGDAYLAMGQGDKAEESYRLALSKKPDNNPVHMNLAQAMELQGHIQDAIREIEAVEGHEKSYPGLSERKARLYLKQGRYPEAETLFLQAAAAPGASRALRLDAIQLNLKSHPREAQTMLEALLKEDARSVRGHTLYAMMKLADNQLPEAAVHIEMASRLGDAPETHLTRALVLLQQNRRADAIATLALARRPPVEGRAMALHARQLADAGVIADALAEVQDLLGRKDALFADRAQYRPEEVRDIVGSAYLLLGDLYGQSQQDDKALLAYRDAAAELPSSGEAAYRFGRALYNSGKRQPGIQQLLRALRAGGDSAPYTLETYLLLGDSYRELHKRAEALRAYQKWLSLAPQDAPERHEVELHVETLSSKR